VLGRIERYTISELVSTDFQMPKGSQLLSVGMVGLSLMLWVARTEGDVEQEERTIFVVQEMSQFEMEGAVLIGNCANLEGLNIHVFERVAAGSSEEDGSGV
jgi:hypothetical protein